MEIDPADLFDLLYAFFGLLAFLAFIGGILIGWAFRQPGKAARHVLREALTDYLAKPEIRPLERRIASSYEARYRDE